MRKMTKSELQMPGTCWRCNAAENREWFLDTTIYLDFHGNVYLCNMCCIDLINASGGLTKEAADAIAQSYEDTLREVEQHFNEELETLRSIQSISSMTLEELAEMVHENDRRIEHAGSIDSVSDESSEPVDEPDDEPDRSDEQAFTGDAEFLLAEYDGTVTGLHFGI